MRVRRKYRFFQLAKLHIFFGKLAILKEKIANFLLHDFSPKKIINEQARMENG